MCASLLRHIGKCGLRDYKLPPSIWGGDPECEHAWEQHIQPAANGIIHDRGMSPDTLSEKSATRGIKKSDFCSKCNAWRGTFGLEPTPELYLEHSVAIFREVRRVLRDDGTLWVNLGDSYATGAGRAFNPGGGENSLRQEAVPQMQPNRMPISGLKSGDLVGIPWRVALALQADGWYLRRDNIWFKPNPMPESVNGWRWEKHRIKHGKGRAASYHSRPSGWATNEGSHANTPEDNPATAEMIDCPGCDKCTPNGGYVLRKGNWRCTTAHEYVFQFSKSDSYFCNAEAARETSTYVPRRSVSNVTRQSGSRRDSDRMCGDLGQVGNRNRRSVWQISTAPYRDAHFATFPPALVRPIILAATSPKCCSECGAPYAPVIERGEPRREQQLACGSNGDGEYHGEAIKDFEGSGAENASTVKARILAGMIEKKVVGYRPTCRHVTHLIDNFAEGGSVLITNDSPYLDVPCVVLDPFGGSGTVGQVAKEEGRDAILIELQANYIPMINKRCGFLV